jgi:hypothetical protein
MASAKCIKKLEFYIYFKMESLCDMCAAMSISLKEPNDNIPVDHPSQETRLYYVVRRGGMVIAWFGGSGAWNFEETVS